MERQKCENVCGAKIATGVVSAPKIGAKVVGSHLGAQNFELVRGEHSLADASVFSAVQNWLAHVYPSLSLQRCIASANVALTNGAQLAELTC